MPSRFEQIQQEQQQMIKNINKFVFGDITKIYEPLNWKDYIKISIKILTPIIAIISYIFVFSSINYAHYFYWISVYFYLAFLIDVAILLYNFKRFKNYTKLKELEGLCVIPKGRHD